VTGIVGTPFWPNGRADERAGVLPRGTRKVFAMAYVENSEFDDDGCFKITFFEDGCCSCLWMEISMTQFSYKIYEINIGEELRSQKREAKVTMGLRKKARVLSMTNEKTITM
jgi:hypothetical protein